MEKRQKNMAGRMWWLAGAFLLLSCRPAYQLADVEGGRVAMTEAIDRLPQNEAAVAIVQSYKEKVDSVMSPVIGRSKMEMDVDRPESLLSNFVADVLLRAGSNYIGHPVDFAVINVGGLRTSLPEGDVTYGDVYEILPFQNTLCILEMKGEAVQALFRQMAAVGGEGLSGARLVLSDDMQLKEARIGGKPVDPERVYQVATIDYLAEGNDGMPAFKEAVRRVCPEGMTIRQVVVDYIKECAGRGEALASKFDGRIRVEE